MFKKGKRYLDKFFVQEGIVHMLRKTQWGVGNMQEVRKQNETKRTVGMGLNVAGRGLKVAEIRIQQDAKNRAPAKINRNC